MRLKPLVFLIFILFCTTVLAQNNRQSQVVAPFLQISPDARGMAMGNTGVATKPNVFSMYYNPARYSFIEDKTTFGASFQDCPISYNLYDISAAQKIGKISTLAASFRYCQYKEIEYRGMANEPLDKYKPYELAIDLAYSIRFGKHLSAALAGRYVNSALIKSDLEHFSIPIRYKTAQDYAFDFGVFYTHEMNLKKFSGNYSFGLSLTNLGGKTGYVKERNYWDNYGNVYFDHDDIDYLPTTIRLGGSADLSKGKNSFALNFDLSKIVVPEFSEYKLNCGVGLEYGRNNRYFGRVGYFNRPSAIGNINYYTVGLGLSVFGFNLDVAGNISTQKGNYYDYLMVALKYGF